MSIDEALEKGFSKQIIAQVLDAGFNLDFIDGDAIDSVGIPYRVLILPAIDRLPVATYEKILAFAQKGGIVIATRRTPATAPGFLHATEDSVRLKQISAELFGGKVPTAHLIQNDQALGATLAKSVTPDWIFSPRTPEIGCIHRLLADDDLYFCANTSNEARHVKAHFRKAAGHGELWDAVSGEMTGIADTQNVPLDLEIVWLSADLLLERRRSTAATRAAPGDRRSRRTLSKGWTVEFEGTGKQKTMDRLVSWTADPQTQYFSGHAVYEKTFAAPAAAAGTCYFVDFGPGTPEALAPPDAPHNMRAYLESPVREAAQVYVNGKLAGAVWQPPYRIDVTAFLTQGENRLRIVVGNTAINALAGQALPDYRLLWDRYGMLFVPQDMQNLQPLPSGILGPVRFRSAQPWLRLA